MLGLAIAPRSQQFQGVATVGVTHDNGVPPMVDVSAMGGDGDDDDHPIISADEAVALFFGDVMAWWAGDAPQFRHVAASYNSEAIKHGWPPLADKALSQKLRKHGCQSRATHKRDAAGRRLSVVLFPATEVSS